MSAQRATQLSLRRLAGQPSMISQMAIQKFAAPAILGASMQQTRRVATSKMSPSDSYEILVAQRKLRPVAPHLSIYKPQIPWILSSLNRITGIAASGAFYLFGSAYLVAPLLGWHLDSATIAAAFGAWPVAAKVAAKFVVAMPVMFHSINGLRHLVWDTGREFAKRSVIRTGWTVVGLTFASSLGLAIFV